MEYYHWIMAGAAILSMGVTAFITRDLAALIGVLVSQVPFWVGLAADLPGPSHPVLVNMVMSLGAAGGFLLLAHMFGGRALAIACLLFATATMLDLTQRFVDIPVYVEMLELIHYSCLILMMGRGYVDRVFSGNRAGAAPE